MTTHRAQHARLLIALVTVWMTAGIGLGSLSGAGGSAGSALAAAPAGCVQPATATNPVCQTWATTYDHPGSADEHGTDVVADPLNPTGPKVYVTGVSSAGLVETVAYDQGTGRQIWQASVAGPTVQARFAHARLAMAPGGATLYVAGAGDGDVSVTAYDTGSGTQLWSTTQSLLPATPDVTGSGPTLDDPVAIQATAAGVFVTTNSGNTAQVVDYSPGGGPNGTGLQLWSSTITGTAPTAEAAAVSPDGSLVYVASYSSSQSATPSIGGVTPSAGASKAISEVVALDSSTGLQKWITIVGTGAAAAEYALLPSSDGSRLVTSGTVESDSGNWDGVVASLDPATGTVQWSITRDTPSDTTQPWNERPAALAMVADASTVYVAGDRYRFTDGQHFEKQYDLYALNVATGAQRWGTSIPGPANYGDKDVYLAAHGSQVALATRSPQSATTSYDIDIRAYDAGTGAQQWQRDVDGTAHGEDVPGAVAYTIVGTAVKVVVTGMSTDPTTGADITTVATTAATGAAAWLSRYDTPLANDDHPFDSTLTPAVEPSYRPGTRTAA